jgi:hypothetical protein
VSHNGKRAITHGIERRQSAGFEAARVKEYVCSRMKAMRERLFIADANG